MKLKFGLTEPVPGKYFGIVTIDDEGNATFSNEEMFDPAKTEYYSASVGSISETSIRPVKTMERRVEELRNIEAIQKSPGNGDVNEYMRGMANGLILALAVMDDRSPEYLEKEIPEYPFGAIPLSSYEKQSGLDRVRFARGLIEQLPVTHEGRNTWLRWFGPEGVLNGASQAMPLASDIVTEVKASLYDVHADLAKVTKQLHDKRGQLAETEQSLSEVSADLDRATKEIAMLRDDNLCHSEALASYKQELETEKADRIETYLAVVAAQKRAMYYEGIASAYRDTIRRAFGALKPVADHPGPTPPPAVPPYKTPVMPAPEPLPMAGAPSQVPWGYVGDNDGPYQR